MQPPSFRLGTVTGNDWMVFTPGVILSSIFIRTHVCGSALSSQEEPAPVETTANAQLAAVKRVEKVSLGPMGTAGRELGESVSATLQPWWDGGVPGCLFPIWERSEMKAESSRLQPTWGIHSRGLERKRTERRFQPAQ